MIDGCRPGALGKGGVGQKKKSQTVTAAGNRYAKPRIVTIYQAKKRLSKPFDSCLRQRI